jgi:hypothetical protein
MNYHLYTVEMPFSGKTLRYKELSTKEQLVLSKANVMLPLRDEFIEEYGQILFEICSNCVLDSKTILDLNIIEYIMFLTKLRIISIGPFIELEFEPLEDEKKMAQKVKITLDLNIFLKTFYEIASNSLDPEPLVFENLKIYLDWPNIKSEKIFLKLMSQQININSVLDTVCEYIKEIKTSENCISLNNFTSDQKLKLYEALPLAVQTKIQSKVLSMVKNISECRLFNYDKLDSWRFSFYNTTYQEILRLFFSFNLHNIYQEYYALASKKINPQCVDNLSVSERKIFISFIEEEIERNKESLQNSSTQGFEGSQELQNLIREFEGPIVN